MSKPIHITDDSFEQEVLKSDIPVLIDFWATWCAPCRLLSPVIDQLADEFDGRVKVSKLDVDNNQQTAMSLGVRSIPAVLIFKNGEIVDNIVGNVPKAKLTERLIAIL
jgi:thioredoxin 1